MIQFASVTKSYPSGSIALDDVSFEIPENDFLFLVGPSGAGKTTILKLIMRQIMPTSGSVMVDDTEISTPQFTQVAVLRRAIGMVFQDFKILRDKSIFENIAIALTILGLSKGEIEEKVTTALDIVGLQTRADAFPVQLSAGELQRIAIARAVVGDRSIILADEPTGNLDPKTAWDIMEIFKKLEGTRTIIIATHNADIVNHMKKRVITIIDGKLADDSKKGGYKL
jgi:cell division transport system ATP-binding protein